MASTPDQQPQKSNTGLYVGLSFSVIVLLVGLIILILWLAGVIFKSKKDSFTDTASSTDTGGSSRKGTATDTAAHGVPPYGLGLTSSMVLDLDFATPMADQTFAVQGDPSFSFSVSPPLPAGLSLEPFTGKLHGTPTTPTAKEIYTITCSNAHGSTSAPLTLTVNDAKLNYAYPGLLGDRREFKAGETVSIVPDWLGTQAPFSVRWSVTPAFPADLGLALDPQTGKISGTAGAAGSAAQLYVITATNSIGGVQQFKLTLSSVTGTPTPPSNVYYGDTHPTYYLNDPIPPNTMVFTGNADTALLANGTTLPAGLTLNPYTGTIEGTPTAALGSVTVNPEVSFNGGTPATATVVISVHQVAPVLGYTVAAPAKYEIGVPIETLVPTQLIGGSLTFTITGDHVAGVSINSSNGTVSGTPTGPAIHGTMTFDAGNVYGDALFDLPFFVYDNTRTQIMLSNYVQAEIPLLASLLATAATLGKTQAELTQLLTEGYDQGGVPAVIYGNNDDSKAQAVMAECSVVLSETPFGVFMSSHRGVAPPRFSFADVSVSAGRGFHGVPTVNNTDHGDAVQYELLPVKDGNTVTVHPKSGACAGMIATPQTVVFLIRGWNSGGCYTASFKVIAT